MRKLTAWFFSPQGSKQAFPIIAWWEVRRIPLNLVIGVFGLGCIVVYALALQSSGQLQPGEDAVEPIALLFAPIAVNVLYTLGWTVELVVRRLLPHLVRSANQHHLRLSFSSLLG